MTPSHLDPTRPVYRLRPSPVEKCSNRCRTGSDIVGWTVSSEAEDSPDAIVPGRALRSMQTGQNSIAPENPLPQLGQLRWGSVLMLLTVLRIRSKLRKEHGSPRQPAAPRLVNQVPGSEPLAKPSSTEWCETCRRAQLASCGRGPIATSCRSTVKVSHGTRVWNKPF